MTPGVGPRERGGKLEERTRDGGIEIVQKFEVEKTRIQTRNVRGRSYSPVHVTDAS